MLSIIKSEKFQKEYKDFNRKISSITDNDQLKTEATELLNKLVNEVRALDAQHQDLIITHQIPTGVDETKNKITELRKKLHRKLSDYHAS